MNNLSLKLYLMHLYAFKKQHSVASFKNSLVKQVRYTSPAYINIW